jgi:hypothetical protein
MGIWPILQLFGTFCGHLAYTYFMVIWNIFICCTKKNLATLVKLARIQSYDRVLQLQRRKNLRRRVLKTKIFPSATKNALAYYNA